MIQNENKSERWYLKSNAMHEWNDEEEIENENGVTIRNEITS